MGCHCLYSLFQYLALVGDIHLSMHICAARPSLCCCASAAPRPELQNLHIHLLKGGPAGALVENNLGCFLQLEHSQGSSHQSMHNLQITKNLCIGKPPAACLPLGCCDMNKVILVLCSQLQPCLSTNVCQQGLQHLANHLQVAPMLG